MEKIVVFSRVLIRSLLLVSAFLSATALYAQDANSVAEPQQQGVGFGTPEAIVQVRDIQMPANYNNGTLDVQVPIYQFTYAGFTLPVGLSYNTSGIKVDDEPTIAGLGWRLNAGGSIVRVVRGTYPDGYGCAFCPGMVAATDYWSQTDFDDKIEKWYDTEPDVYYFSTPTCSGMFVMDGTSIVQIPYQNLSITAENNETGGHFYISDQNGIDYTFGLADNSKDISTQVKLKWNKSTQEYDSDSYEFVSAWHLTAIDFKGVHVANLFYEPSESERVMEIRNQTKVYSVANINPSGIPDYAASDRRGEKLYETTGKIVTSPNYLSCITWPAGRISFDVAEHKLSEVVMEDKSGDYVTSVCFDYGTFYNGLLKLKSVKETDAVAGDTTVIAEFLYNECDALLHDMRSHSDYFGYYNGSRGGLTSGIRHKNENYNALDYVLTSKYPDLQYTVANSLRRIIYPLGGYKEFHYELNAAGDDFNAAEFMASGLRIRKVEECAYHGAVPAVTEYIYGSDAVSGTLDGKGTRTNNIPLHVTSLSVGGEDRRLYYAVSEKCLTTLADMDGSSVQYPIVWEILPDGSKNEYKYTTYSDYQDQKAQKRVAYDNTRPWTDMQQGPVTQTSLHYARGLLTEKSSYDKNGELVYCESHTYSLGEEVKSLDVVVPYRGIVEGYVFDPDEITTDQYLFCKYKWISQPVRRTYTDVLGTKYSSASTTEYVYNPIYNVPVKIIRRDAQGDVYETFIKYPFDYDASSTSAQPVSQALANMRMTGRNNTPIETVTFKNEVAIEGRIDIYKTSAMRLAEQKYLPQLGVSLTDYVFSSLSEENGFVCDSNYRTDVAYYDWDLQNRPLSFRKRDGNMQSLVYDRMGNVIAEADNARHSRNASLNTVFYSSFEAMPDEGPYYGDYAEKAKSGDYVLQHSVSVPVSNINGEYVVVYWRSSDDGATWNRVEYTVAGDVGSITVNASSVSWVDEVRILPEGARMRTKTYGTNYNKLLTETDENGVSVYYEYDGFGRPRAMFDNDGNCVEEYEIEF